MSGRPRVFVFRKVPFSERIAEILSPVADLTFHDSEDPPPAVAVNAALPDAAALLPTALDPVPAALIECAPRLRVIGNYGVGYNNVDVAAATRRRIAVSNTPGVLTEATADTTWALIMAVARRTGEADAYVREGKFDGWRASLFLGMQLAGKTLGIVGLGLIGQAVARRALGFGMRVLYAGRRRAAPEVEAALQARFAALDALLREADIVSLHCPLTSETRHLLDARRLGFMKPTAYLINTARGPIVEERALVEALRARRIAGAGLDVYEDEPRLAPGLAELPNAVLFPHIGSSTLEAREGMARLAAENILAALEGRRPPNLVNHEVWPG
jgi:glyoxylate reductase